MGMKSTIVCGATIGWHLDNFDWKAEYFVHPIGHWINKGNAAYYWGEFG